MKIKYIHHSEPGVEKILDTKVHRQKSDEFSKTFGFGGAEPQEKHDKWLLEKLAREKEEGLILSYEVIAEEES